MDNTRPAVETEHKQDKARKHQATTPSVETAAQDVSVEPDVNAEAAAALRAFNEPRTVTPEHILALQRTAGNRAVTRLLQRRTHPDTQVIQRLGQNIWFSEKPNERMLFTEQGKHVMRVDPESKGLKQSFDEHMEKINKTEGGFWKSAPEMKDKLQRMLDQVASLPYKEKERTTELKSKGVEDLGDMLQKGWIVCWEKAAFTHLLLTELGIANAIISGKEKTDQKKHHAWIEVLGTPFSIESTAGIIAPTAEYEERFTIYDKKPLTRPKYNMHPEDTGELLATSPQLRKGLVSKIAI